MQIIGDKEAEQLQRNCRYDYNPTGCCSFQSSLDHCYFKLSFG